MLSRLLLAVPLLLQAAAPSPQQGPAISPPPIKMGLWEAAITTGMGTKMTTRSCLDAQSYREQLAHMPPGCTLSNQQKSSTTLSGDVSCNLQNGASSSGHFDAQFPDASTVHATINMTTSIQGRTMPITITTDSHFVSADCGDLQPGQSKVLH